MPRLILCLSLLITNAAFASAEKAFSEVKDLLFQVKTSASANLEKSSYGTGFVIDKQGLLITNYHVVSEALWKPEKQKIFVVIEGKNEPGEILQVDYINDLAVVKVDKQFKNQIQITKNPPKQGEDIYTFGLPEDIEWVVTKGIYNGTVKRGPYEQVHMTTSLNPGMSGGPTLNERNELVAVNSSIYMFSQQISFGVPYQKVINLLKRNPKRETLGEADRKNELQTQLGDLQEEMTAEILDAFANTKEISKVKWPNFSKYVKCWGEASNERDVKYTSENETCQPQLSVPLVDSTYTGSFKFETEVFQNRGLNSLAWHSLKTDRWTGPLSGVVNFVNKDSKINFSKPKCIRKRVMSPGQPLTLAICSQKVLPLDDLYEIYVMAMKPLGPEKFVRSNFALSGFSQKNMKKIVAAFADLKFEEDK